jgi:fluoride ion exporter CrcB/FEX
LQCNFDPLGFLGAVTTFAAFYALVKLDAANQNLLAVETKLLVSCSGNHLAVAIVALANAFNVGVIF